jgi:hypothetical protein
MFPSGGLKKYLNLFVNEVLEVKASLNNANHS